MIFINTPALDGLTINDLCICRFDYIVRDTRACGLGCNFQPDRCFFLFCSELFCWGGCSVWQLLCLFQAYTLVYSQTPNIELTGWWRQCKLWVTKYVIVQKIVSTYWKFWYHCYSGTVKVNSIYYPDVILVRSDNLQVICNPCWLASDSLYPCKSEGELFHQIEWLKIQSSLLLKGKKHLILHCFLYQAIELMVIDALAKASPYLSLTSSIHQPSEFWKVLNTPQVFGVGASNFI